MRATRKIREVREPRAEVSSSPLNPRTQCWTRTLQWPMLDTRVRRRASRTSWLLRESENVAAPSQPAVRWGQHRGSSTPAHCERAFKLCCETGLLAPPEHREAPVGSGCAGVVNSEWSQSHDPGSRAALLTASSSKSEGVMPSVRGEPGERPFLGMAINIVTQKPL